MIKLNIYLLIMINLSDYNNAERWQKVLKDLYPLKSTVGMRKISSEPILKLVVYYSNYSTCYINIYIYGPYITAVKKLLKEDAKSN